VSHYENDTPLGIALSPEQENDLVQYLLSLGDAPLEDPPGNRGHLRAAAPRALGGGAIRLAGPNPTRGEVTIDLALPAATTLSAGVYDVAGRKVATLSASESFAAGPHRLAWDGRAPNGAPAAPGIYFVRVGHAGGTWSRTVTVVP
jgi:hypothetical protein